MTGRGKRGKPKGGFPTLSTALGNPAKSSGIPTRYKRAPLFAVGVGMVCGWHIPTRRRRPMSGTKYIGMDVHISSLVVAVVDERGKVVRESILETKAPAILAFIGSVPGNLHVTLEE